MSRTLDGDIEEIQARVVARLEAVANSQGTECPLATIVSVEVMTELLITTIMLFKESVEERLAKPRRPRNRKSRKPERRG